MLCKSSKHSWTAESPLQALKKGIFFSKVTEEMKTFLLCPFCFLGYTYRMVTTQHLSIGLTMAFPCPFLCVFYCAVILLFQPQREHQLLGEAFMTLTVLCPLLETVCFLLYHFVWHSLCLVFYVVYIIPIQSAELSFSVSRTHHGYFAIPPSLPPFLLNRKLRSKKTKNCQPIACMEQGYLSLIFKYGS